MPHIGPYYMNKPGYKQVGTWGWDNQRLSSKIDALPDENGCRNWQGAMSPSGALMGAWKRKDGVMIQQMTQVRRLIQMDVMNEDISDYQVKLTCGNQACCSREHFILKPNNRIAVSKPVKSVKQTKREDVKSSAKKWWNV